MSPAAPSGESRPADLAPAASLQAPGGAPFAAAAPAARLARIAGSAIRPDDASAAARPNLDAATPATRAPVDGTGARPWPTALQSAAERGDVDALKALLAESSTRVDAPDAAGRTALLHAVLAQQAAAVRLLLAAGADPARAAQAGLTPRAAAQAAGNAEIAGLLGAPR